MSLKNPPRKNPFPKNTPSKQAQARKSLRPSVKQTSPLHSPTKKYTLSKLREGVFDGTIPLQGLGAHSFERPSFSDAKERAARLEAALATQNDHYLTANLDQMHEDLAAPHRAPYARLRDLVFGGDCQKLQNAIDELTEVSKKCEEAFRNVTRATNAESYHELARLYEKTREAVIKAHDNFKTPSLDDNVKFAYQLDLVKALNNLASNAPGLGPHSTANDPVRDRLHLHPIKSGGVTPRGEAASRALPSVRVATRQMGREIVSVTGHFHSLQPGQTLALFEDVPAQPRVFRGCLFVDQKGNVFRPVLDDDWEQVF